MKANKTNKTKLDQFDSLQFRKYIQSFCESHNLLHFNKCDEQKILLSVSGGVDSMALMDIFFKLLPTCEVLHFNHGTRGEDHLKEQNLIESQCLKANRKFHLKKFHSLKISQSNFEEAARMKRLAEYKHFQKLGYKIITAHHLNDSFEWSQMQSFKQSQLQTTLGIPVVSNGMVRPFLCVSKEQILNYARQENLKWIEDSSNLNTKFERNSFRLKIESEIKHAYPQYLKHYVARSNELAYLLGKHCLSQKKRRTHSHKDQFGGLCLLGTPSLEKKSEYKKWIHHFSSSKRGTIESELDKVLQSIDRDIKQKKSFLFKGPIDFTGGAKVLFFHDHLYFFNDSISQKWEEFDQSLLAKCKLQKQSTTQIPYCSYFYHFPFLAILKPNSHYKKVKWAHPLLKVTLKWLKVEEIPYTFTQLLDKKHRQKLIEDGLRLDSSSDGL